MADEPDTEDAAYEEQKALWEEATSGVSPDEPDAAAKEAAAEATEQPAGPEAEDAPQAEPAGDDIWSNADPKLKAAFDEQLAKAATAEHGRKSAEARYASAQRRLDSVMTGRQSPAPAKQSPATRSPLAGLSKEQIDSFQKFRAEYPEFAGPIEPLLSAMNAALQDVIQENATLRAGMETIGEDRQNSASNAAEAEVLDTHPDLDTVLDGRFMSWLADQPDGIRDMYDQNAVSIVNAGNVNKLLSLYKADMGATGNGQTRSPIRTMQQRSAAAPQRRAPAPSVGEAPAAAEDWATMWKQAAKDANARIKRRMETNGLAL